MCLKATIMKTKHYFLLMIAILLYTNSSAQAGLNATLNSFKRSTPLIGFNGNAARCTSTWTVQTWLDTVKTLNAAMFRYPGGTNANHFDWQTGYWQNAASTPTWVANLTCTATVKAEDFQLGLTACQAKPLMILNFQYSNVTYQIQGLDYAVSKGVPVEHIEIGNEHNILASTQQYIPASTYATNTKIWADSIKTHYPNSKICLVGGATTNSTHPVYGWHDSIFSKNPNIEALSFHLYMGCGNSDNKFCSKRALSIPFHATLGVANRYAQARFTQTVIPSNIEVWTTEYNMSENLFAEPMQHAGTWTHGLYISVLSHLLLKENKITMMLDHNVTTGVEFGAVDINSLMTSSGVAMSLLGSASKGTDSTALIDFNGQASVTWSTTSYPSLIGWKFWKTNSNTKNVWISNLSAQTIKVSADQIIGTNFSYDHYKADTNFVVNGIKSLSITSGFSTDSITIPPYSITILKNLTSTSLKEKSKNDDLTFFPNPVSQTLYLSKSVSAVKIYDVYGRIIKTYKGGIQNIAVDELGEGIYFLQTEHYSKRFIVKH